MSITLDTLGDVMPAMASRDRSYTIVIGRLDGSPFAEPQRLTRAIFAGERERYESKNAWLQWRRSWRLE